MSPQDLTPYVIAITAIRGDSDPAISAEMLRGWRAHTSAAFSQHELPGGHFYIHAEREAVLSVDRELTQKSCQQVEEPVH